MGLLGLGVRAGRVVVGTGRVRSGLQSDSVHAVVLASDRSPRTEQKVERLARAKGVPVLTGPDALKKAYKNDADVTRVRASAAFALGMIGDTTAVPALLTALRDKATRVRAHADLALRTMSKRNLGFKAGAPEAEREAAAKAWDAWWKVRLKK